MTPHAMAADRVPRRCFFGVGVNRYSDEGITRLKFCVADVHTLGVFLKTHGAFANWVLTDEDATQDEVLRQLKDLLDGLQAGDILVVLLAMHGVVEDTGDQILYLHSANLRHARQGVGTLRMSVLRDMVAAVEGLEVLFLVDACRAPLVATRGVHAPVEPQRLPTRDAVAKRQLSTSRRAHITELYACSDGERVPELRSGNGLFTACVDELWRSAWHSGQAVAPNEAFMLALRARMGQRLQDEFGDALTVTPMLVQAAPYPPVVLPARASESSREAQQPPPPPPDAAPRPAVMRPSPVVGPNRPITHQEPSSFTFGATGPGSAAEARLESVSSASLPTGAGTPKVDEKPLRSRTDSVLALFAAVVCVGY
ncbi:MAG: caspase family protein, partial [Planctomycetes bacterium]|nr:caspase family protein [Planctomycetota bacterium]